MTVTEVQGMTLADAFTDLTVLEEARTLCAETEAEAERALRQRWARDYVLERQVDYLRAIGAQGTDEAHEFFTNHWPTKDESRTGRMSLSTMKALGARNVLGGAGQLPEVLEVLGIGCESLDAYLPRRDRKGRLRPASLEPPVMMPPRAEIEAEMRAEYLSDVHRIVTEAEEATARAREARALYESGALILGAGGVLMIDKGMALDLEEDGMTT